MIATLGLRIPIYLRCDMRNGKNELEKEEVARDEW